MNAGRLRHTITLQKYTKTPDGEGGWDKTWNDTVTSVRASVEPLLGREYLMAGQIQERVTTRIRMRYRTDVTGEWRVKHGNRIYEIDSVMNPREMNRETVLMCREIK